MVACRRVAVFALVLSANLYGCLLPDYRLTSSGTDGSTSAGGGTTSGGGTMSAGGALSSGSGGSGGASSSSGGTGGTDPTCDNGTCLPVLSQGTYAIKAGLENQTCPKGWAPAGNFTTTLEPGVSGMCQCGPAAGGSCAPLGLQAYSSAGCATVAGTVVVASSACFELDSSFKSYAFVPQVQTAGACQPALQFLPPEPMPLQTLCIQTPGLPQDTACETGKTCLQPIDAAFGKPCQKLPVDTVSCPAGWGTTPQPVYIKPVDGHTYECFCGAAVNETCAGGQVDLFPTMNCSGSAEQTVEAGGDCASYGSPSTYSGQASLPDVTGGSCGTNLLKSGRVSFEEVAVLCCQ
jgi:hypothetical protein